MVCSVTLYAMSSLLTLAVADLVVATIFQIESPTNAIARSRLLFLWGNLLLLCSKPLLWPFSRVAEVAALSKHALSPWLPTLGVVTNAWLPLGQPVKGLGSLAP